MRARAADQLVCFGGRGRDQNVGTAILQNALDQLARVAIVIDHQDRKIGEIGRIVFLGRVPLLRSRMLSVFVGIGARGGDRQRHDERRTLALARDSSRAPIRRAARRVA